MVRYVGQSMLWCYGVFWSRGGSFLLHVEGLNIVMVFVADHSPHNSHSVALSVIKSHFKPLVEKQGRVDPEVCSVGSGEIVDFVAWRERLGGKPTATF